MTRLKNIIVFSRYFFKKGIIFRKNKEKKILILDDFYLNFNLGYSSEKINFNKINLYYLLKVIIFFTFNFNKYSLKETYKKILYESYNPIIAIGNNLSLKTFECKNLCPDIKVITYQFSWINGYGSGGFDPRSRSLKKYNQTDYFLILNKQEKKVLSKFYKTKFIIVGFLRNNQILLKKIRKKKYFITYISDYEKQPAPITQKLNCEKFILKLLNEYCERNKKKLVLALKANRSDKKINRLNEVKYYENLLGKKFIKPKINSYKVVNNSELSVCLSSSLGLEMFSRASKVFFLPFLSKFSKKLICYYTPSNKSFIFIHGKLEKMLLLKNRKTYIVKKRTMGK